MGEKASRIIRKSRKEVIMVSITQIESDGEFTVEYFLQCYNCGKQIRSQLPLPTCECGKSHWLLGCRCLEPLEQKETEFHYTPISTLDRLLANKTFWEK